MSSTVTVQIPPADREVLSAWTGSPAPRAGLAQRARIVLLAEQGLGTNEIARLAGASKPTVIAWRRRYAEEGLPGLDDRPRPGPVRRTADVAVVLATLEPPPARLGVTRWTARLLAAELGISSATVARVWRKWGLSPWLPDGLHFATAPKLDTRIADVVGIYLNPPTNAFVVRIDDGSGIEPPGPTGLSDLRDRAMALSAALEGATGKVIDADYPRRHDIWFPAFLQQVAEACPGQELHLVVDSRSTGGHPAVAAWLAGNSRVKMHLVPTAGSWPAMVEICFAVTSRRASGHGTIDGVDLTAAVGAFLEGWSERARPFLWVEDADPVGARLVVEQLPERDPSFPDPSRTTGELATAIEALCKRLDALESVIGKVGVCRAPADRSAAPAEPLHRRPDASGSTGGKSPRWPAGDAVPASGIADVVLGADTRDVAVAVDNWMLDRIKLNTGPEYTRGEVSGSLVYGGVVRTPGSGEVRWQAEHTVPDAMACDIRSAAAVLAAMGHPVRLELLRRMLLGASTVGELHDTAGVDTASQVQHHMRELRAGGLVVSRRRNHYAIPPDRVIPILMIVGTALGRRIKGSAGPDPAGDEDPTDPVAADVARDAAPDTNFWLLDRLAHYTGPRYTRGDISGSLAYSVVARMPSRAGLWWQGEFSVPDVLAADLPSAAVVLAALGHPLRLQLLGRLLLGASTIDELQQIDGIGSSGQVHHHLRELRAAGYVASAKRNHYAVPGDRVAHYLVTMAACVGRRAFAAAGPGAEVDDR